MAGFTLPTPEQTHVPTLGPARFRSPMLEGTDERECAIAFADDRTRVLVNDIVTPGGPGPDAAVSFEMAGPRREVFFEPGKTKCAIVTCGGVCPGLNDVIRAVVMQAHYRYGVQSVFGIRYGYEGLNPAYGHPVVTLTPDEVNTLHVFGGTELGLSRGSQPVDVMVDRLAELGVDILFVVGGDGSQRGANDIFLEARRRGQTLAVVGIPKTIDNDLMFMDKSFGYETAFSAALDSVRAAHTESLSSRNGVGLVKLMGRDSGFIACSAALATGDVNAVLIPEVPFRLEGEHGLLNWLERRLAARRHAVIVVAEGAGQDLDDSSLGCDKSGNRKLADIGLLLKDRIGAHFKERQVELNLKYIDPSYIIRSVPASANDSLFCYQLGRHAVHAAMAGKTGMVIGRWHQHFVHLPMGLVTQGRRKVDPDGDLWMAVIEATGQPPKFG